MIDWKWINIFVRDILLILVIAWVNYAVSYRSWVAAALAGMMIVLITWHFNDLIKERRGLE